MRDYERDDLVVDVADALTLHQEVQWDRCERLATPANRWVLENLRAFSGIFAGGRLGAGDAQSGWVGSASAPYVGTLVVRLAVCVLITFAALQVAATLGLGLWGREALHREYGQLHVFLSILIAGHVVTACLFLFAGRRDRRTWLLGVYFLLQATVVSPFPLLGVLQGVPPTEPFGYPNFWQPYVYPFLFAPAFLWAFARECPRMRRRTRLDDLARRMVGVCVAVGCFASAWAVAWLALARAGHVDPAAYWMSFDGLFVVLNLLALAAVAVVALRAHTAPAAEARRVALFGCGFLMVLGLQVVYDVVEVFSPGGWLSNYRWSPAVMTIHLLRFPGIILLWYSVLAVRVPHLREAIRGGGRRLLLRGRLLEAVLGVVTLVLGWLIASRPERPIGVGPGRSPGAVARGGGR